MTHISFIQAFSDHQHRIDPPSIGRPSSKLHQFHIRQESGLEIFLINEEFSAHAHWFIIHCEFIVECGHDYHEENFERICLDTGSNYSRITKGNQGITTILVPTVATVSKRRYHIFSDIFFQVQTATVK